METCYSIYLDLEDMFLSSSSFLIPVSILRKRVHLLEGGGGRIKGGSLEEFSRMVNGHFVSVQRGKEATAQRVSRVSF